MRDKILVIGGTRFFGIQLVQRLVDAGHDVTIATRGQTPDRFGDRVRRVVVDRRDLAAMTAAFAAADGYDVVYDQMCYSPRDAAIATAVLAGRVQRYIMASTLEVYRHRYGELQRPFVEADAGLAEAAVALDEARYAEAKRGAEALLARDARLPAVCVRIGHVLAGPEDFTGRLASYVAAVRARRPLRHAAGSGATSFISAAGIAELLVWAGGGTFLGALNAASHAWSAPELYRRVAGVLGEPASLAPVDAPIEPTQLSAFDYASPFAMSTARADDLGYRFDRDDRWLDDAIREHAAARAA